MSLNSFNKVISQLKNSETMPVLFVGHGNPMNAITQNEFTDGWRLTGEALPKPSAIICISAHWETNGTFVTAMEEPKTIHDFYGFPPALFDVQYPAPGSPQLATEMKDTITKTLVELDHKWGLDHGCWSVVKKMFPSADIPVIELSLDYTKPSQWHYELAGELSFLRRKGALIIGSGNMVHNLRLLNWQGTGGFEWAIEANEKIKNLISNNEHQQLIHYNSLGKDIQLAVPTPEHFLPLLYVLGLKDDKDSFTTRLSVPVRPNTYCRAGSFLSFLEYTSGFHLYSNQSI